MKISLKKSIQLSFLLAFIGLLLVLFSFFYKQTNQELISLFPLNNYEQNVEAWIDSNDKNYHSPLLNSAIQKKYMNAFFNYYFGVSSPWDAAYVKQLLSTPSPHDIKSIEQNIIKRFSERVGKGVGFGANFRPYTMDEFNVIAKNIELSQLDYLRYDSSRRAIAVNNLSARILPTDEVFFYNHKIAGEGYPFDNLQISAVWAGTPLYIIAESKDRAWSMVITPEFIGWVRTGDIARISDTFANTWITAAKKNLAAITHTQVPIIDNKGQFRFSAYIGSVFPIKEKNNSGMTVLIPAVDENQKALIKEAKLSLEHAALMPLNATPYHFAKIMKTLVGRSYGWGGAYFFNDCSAELKSIFTPFGIWLPRHSAHQINIGKKVDITASTPEKRIAFLAEKANPFFTLVYIGGHIFMYTGTYPTKRNSDVSKVVMTYQNIWGLRPNPSTGRSVIGKAVFFPLLLQYPENTNLDSLANRKYFQVSYLDQEPNFDYKQGTKELFN